MLYCQLLAFLREVEHVEDEVLRTSVLAVVDSVHHLYDGFALMYDLGLSIQSDDGQFTLHQYAIVHHGMVVPAEFFPCGEHLLHGHQFGATLQIVGQVHAVPALAGTNQLSALHLGFL